MQAQLHVLVCGLHICTYIRMRKRVRFYMSMYIHVCMYIHIHIYICVMYIYIYIHMYMHIFLFSLADLGGGRRHVGSTGKVACGSPRRAPPHTYQEQPLQGRSYHAHIQATLVCMGIDDACLIAAIFLVTQSL